MSKRCKQCKKKGGYYIKTLEIKTYSSFLYPVTKSVPLNIEVLCKKCVDQLSGVFQQQLILSQYVTFSYVFYFQNTRRSHQLEEGSSSESDYVPEELREPKKKIKTGIVKRSTTTRTRTRTRTKKKKKQQNYRNKQNNKSSITHRKQQDRYQSDNYLVKSESPKNALTFSAEPKNVNKATKDFFSNNQNLHQPTKDHDVRTVNKTLTNRHHFGNNNKTSNQITEIVHGKEHGLVQEQEQEQKNELGQIPFFEPINWGIDLNLGSDFEMDLGSDLNFEFETQTEFKEIDLLNMKEDNVVNFSNFLQSYENSIYDKHETQQKQIQEEKQKNNNII
ncbi:hypothetical protein M0812_11617 [Anaeramoeba flamelloides]|uniref:ZAD domain-containing protein n=1 Tax=Anaeramoeba flamelloides TaxID=1746091 RepID=A0AAV7ZWN9_9EUKA|nr:hypothetical protein M0812_11617 [Anaeramoeba flamelloides]